MLLPAVALPLFRSSFTLRLVIVCLASLLFVEASSNPIIKGQNPDNEDVIRVSTDLSVFPIRVRARGSNIPVQLSADDFQLKDPDQITTSSYFAAGAYRVALVFALDESGSL